MSNQKSFNLVRSTSIVGSLTLLSRILGFFREILVARLFGATLAADAYFVALRIPNLLRSVFAEGALTSAFVPVFTKELRTGTAEAQRAFSAVATVLILATTLLSIFGIVNAKHVVDLFAPGFSGDPEKFALCVALTQIMFPYIIFVSIVALLNGALNSLRVFGISAWAQVIMNLILIAGAYGAGYFGEALAARILAWSVLGGGAIQVLSQIPALHRAGLSFTLSPHIFIAPVRLVLSLMVPAILGAAVYQVTIFLNTQLASLLETGSVAWLSYADRLTQLPIGVFTIALASVLLPALSSAWASQNTAVFNKSLSDALRYTSFFMIPVSAVLILFAEPLIAMMFERGQFTHYATQKTAHAVQMYSIGLWAVSCHSMVMRAFTARHDTRTPTVLGIITLLGTLFFSLMFMGPLAHQEPGSFYLFLIKTQAILVTQLGGLSLGHAGLALASGISFYLTFLAALTIFWFRSKIPLTPFVWGSVKALIAALIGASLVHFGDFYLYSNLIQIVVGIPLFTAAYLIVSFLLKNPELKETFSLISRKLDRVKRSPENS